ncbi:NifU family protein [uncultured Parolsenella sp.]|uniref:NifU family protein n=1 Tax=uncultured Parolsenella sp. TaxID=2083008 RepID=UPI0027D99A3D|nr:NifU family protein [uncultured Parolsenella sp.]
MAVDIDLLKTVLDAVRPSLQADGGDCELVGVDDDGVVSLELTGACAGCSLSDLTLSQGVERVLVENVPGVTRVQAVM